MNEQRESWFETLFSTQPAGREAAESGVRAFYEATELEAPRQIIWLDSPAEACCAASLLCAGHEPLLGQITAAFEKMPGPRAELARIRENVKQSIGAADWNAATAAVGAPLAGMGAPARYDFQGKITVTRIGFWKDASAAMGKVSEDELFLVETRFWGVIAQALQTQGTMMQGSVSRKYHLAWMARDEAAVENGPAPPLLTAAWQVARSAGPWWPFRNAAIITERPLEVHRNAQWLLERGDGPAIRYRDGWQAFAWDGYSMPEKWIMQPESIAASRLKQADRRFRAYLETRGVAPAATQKVSPKPSSIFNSELSSEPTARIEFLRKHAGGRLLFYERYQNGERREVWSELVRLGAAVRTDPHAADALAVAYETMLRVEANVRVIVERLHNIGYQFVTDESKWQKRRRNIESALAIDPPVTEQGLRSPHVRKVLEMMKAAKGMLFDQFEVAKNIPRDTSVRAHVRPPADAVTRIRKLEKKLGTLPLSLRAFYEVVGSIDLMGQHSSLTPHGGPISADPLVVFAVDDALAEGEEFEQDDDETAHIVIAPDEIHKAGESGGEPYEMAVPDERADGELLNERHGVFFVEYLRTAFRFGGFPGYEGYDRDVPKEISELREGLLEF